MTEAEKLERKKKITKRCMIALTVSFIVLMLIIPLITVITGALKEGFSFYIKAGSTIIRSLANLPIQQSFVMVFSETQVHVCLHRLHFITSLEWKHWGLEWREPVKMR